MFNKRPFGAVALAACIIVALAAGPALATSAAATPVTAAPNVPQIAASQLSATWLASQFGAKGYIPSSITPGTPDLSSTANAVLALAGSGVSPTVVHAAVSYLENNVAAYVTVDGADGPGQLSLLILDAHVAGIDPTNFGGTNLVSRLLATQRAAGTDAGLFGSQDPTYDGAFRQGLSLAALASAGVTTGLTAPIAWLDNQQCSGGGWTSYVTVDNPCNGSPADFEGPDTNSTSLALEGLAAQHALTSGMANSALTYLTGAQDSDGGWGYYPTTDTPGNTDPDSTGLVIQAILAMGLSPASDTFRQGTNSPVATLLSFQLTSGANAGAYIFPGSSAPSLLATYQATPALAGVVFPFASTTTTATSTAVSSNTGASTLYSARVTTAVGTPSGSVQFAVGSTVLCTTGALSGGSGSCLSASSTSGGVVRASYINPSNLGSSIGTIQGYWEVASDGGVFSYGNANFYGSMGGKSLVAPVVAMAPTADARGYWEVASDGGIFAFGDAAFYGSMGGQPLAKPVVSLAATPDGLGYWEVASDGGIFAFGDAAFYGSMGGQPLAKPVVSIAATPDGLGYWEVASDGGIFAFGDAAFYGSMGGQPLTKPVVSLAATPDGLGYWEVASDGGIFAFGDAAFYGSMGGQPLTKPVVSLAATPDGLGYWEVASDGGIFAFGDANFLGSQGGQPLVAPVVGIASTSGDRV